MTIKKEDIVATRYRANGWCIDDRGMGRWAVTNGTRDNLGKDGAWYYEPLPSSRDDEFLQNCRYESIDEALMYLNQFLDEATQ